MKKLEGFYSGINFGGWFSQCDYSEDRLNNFIKEEDFAAVKNWGYDHVRIPVDYNIFQNHDGSFIEDGFERIDRVIDLCRKNGLNMILDLHKTAGFSFDDGEAETGLFENERYQDMFVSLWKEFSVRYAKNSDMLAFELLNEVTDPAFMPKWNEIASRAIGVIREYSKDIKILMGGFYNNSAEAVPYIDVPLDENIVYNFHCYEPIMFTHQGAYWIKDMKPDFRMAYKSTFGEYVEKMKGVIDYQISWFDDFDRNAVPDESYFEQKFAGAIKYAEEKGVALYCGEYGVIELASIEDTEKWYKDIHAVFTKHGIGHALWSYREMDFDFAGERMDPVRDAISESSHK